MIQVYASIHNFARDKFEDIERVLDFHKIRIEGKAVYERKPYALILQLEEEKISQLRLYLPKGTIVSKRVPTYFKTIYVPPSKLRPSDFSKKPEPVKELYLKWEKENRISYWRSLNLEKLIH